jgi:hypothetical protein
MVTIGTKKERNSVAVALTFTATMAAMFAVTLLRIPKSYQQAIRIIIMMGGLWCAISLRHAFI